ncbi:hypothetical protein [Xylocopilactobacillus apicola]|uniref:Uncharacterized protein n=1 Tax=Xylocopilactobacillus apicola TaxID=2932184 RepID=A0AAU9DE99_9LACO|nr:hypothetical protein [Xylocopilactobacillus apicola]BDR58185.1 hypothetical protein XA3_06260 [Xylocopilactobacillus apicola]
MKKIRKVLIIFVSIITVPMIAFAVYMSVYSYQHNIARNKGYKEISTVVPISRQIRMEDNTPTRVLSFFPKSYEINITTKEDYEHWKKLVLKRGKLLYGDGPHSHQELKEYVKDVNHCELFYSSEQTVKNTKPDESLAMLMNGYVMNPDPKSPYTNQKGFKTWNDAIKNMYDNFACVPSNHDLIEKWKFPKKNIEEMNTYRKKLGK